MKYKVLKLSLAEYEHVKVTLEGVKEELEELSAEFDFYASALPERIDDCLALVEGAEDLDE